jgi:hypothetical protein
MRSSLHQHRVPNLLGSLLIAAIVLLGAIAEASAAAQQVWLISTREVTCSDNADEGPQAFSYWRLDGDCQWVAADARQFYASDDAAVPTVVFIHGDKTDGAQAVEKGWYVYESIREQVGDRAFRFVIWSWPAERAYLLRPRSDARLKASYCDTEGFHLATWLNGLSPKVKVTLTGHSFGPRIIANAMEFLAGRQLSCGQLPAETVAAWTGGTRNRVRAVFLAAAIDADGLAPGQGHDRALALLDEVLITCNDRDHVLRRYPRLNGRGGPPAMGFVGPCGVGCPENVRVVDVTCAVGWRHDWRWYTDAVCCQWGHYLFLDEAAPSPPGL